MVGRAVLPTTERSVARGCHSRRQPEKARRSAPAASDRPAPTQFATGSGARQRPLPEAEIVFGGEVSCCPPRERVVNRPYSGLNVCRPYHPGPLLSVIR